MGNIVVRRAEARQKAVEIIRNGGSLDDAVAATGMNREYVRKLGVKEGIRIPRGKYKCSDDYGEVIALYWQGYSAKDVAEMLGRNRGTVNQIWRKANLPRQLTPLQRTVKELREEGNCCVEIAEKTGLDPSQIRHIVDAIGMPFAEDEVRRSIALGKQKAVAIQHGSLDERVEKQRQFVEDNYPGWEYVDGFTASDGFMTLRHKPCGTVVKKSSVTIRHKKGIKCPICAERERKRAAEEKQRLLKMEREQRRLERIDRKQYTQITFRTCEQCGNLYVGVGKYCSEQCRKRAINRRHDRRISNIAVKDLTITLEKLYERDSGVCYICGGLCDYNDYQKDRNGSFIVGYDYPSIDHVYPISRGGTHTWDNVKLAHHYCNTLKRARVVS